MTDPFYLLLLPATFKDANDRNRKVFVEVRYDGKRLSMTGFEGPFSNGNAYGSCGQISRSPEYVAADGWTDEMVARLFEIWDRWHLNDMQAGSPAQRDHLATLTFPGYPFSHYKWASEQLKEVGLNPDPGHLVGGKPYKYGSGWLTEEVPAEILSEIQSFPLSSSSLPGEWGIRR